MTDRVKCNALGNDGTSRHRKDLPDVWISGEVSRTPESDQALNLLEDRVTHE